MGVMVTAALAVAGALLLTAGCATRTAPPAAGVKPSDDTAMDQALAHFAQGLVFEWQEKPDREAALLAYREAARYDPSDPELRLMAARNLLELQRPAEALDLLAEASRELPDSPEIRFSLARVAMVSERYDVAAPEYLAAARLAATPAERTMALSTAAYAFFTLQQDREAHEALSLLSEVPPYSIRLPEGVPESAKDDLPEREPRIQAIRFAMELAELRLNATNANDSARAYAEWAEKAARGTSERADVWEIFGAAAARVKKTALASEALRRAAVIDPLRTYALLSAIAIEKGIRVPDVTPELLHGEIAAKPGNAALHVALARLLVEKGRPAEAAPQVEAALDAWPAKDGAQALPAEFWLFHGSILERSGRLEVAEAVFRKALEAHPDFAPIQNYLAYMLAEQSRELEEAETLVKAALRQEPENGAYLDTLGWIYYRMGRLPEALIWLLHAAEKDQDAEILDHVGDVLAALGRTPEAIAYWSMALHLDPDRKDAADKITAAGGTLPERE